MKMKEIVELLTQRSERTAPALEEAYKTVEALTREVVALKQRVAYLEKVTLGWEE